MESDGSLNDNVKRSGYTPKNGTISE